MKVHDAVRLIGKVYGSLAHDQAAGLNRVLKSIDPLDRR